MELSISTAHLVTPNHSPSASWNDDERPPSGRVDELSQFLGRFPAIVSNHAHQVLSDRLKVFPSGMRAGAGAKVLSIGEDALLVGTRELILLTVGYQVRSILGNKLSPRDYAAPVDVVIICHTLGDSAVTRIVANLRRHHPRIPILYLGAQCCTAVGNYDYPVDVSFGPRTLLRTLQQTLRQAS